MKVYRLLLFMLSCYAFSMYGSVVSDDLPSIIINEVVSKNGESFEDPEGDAPDWIELYNTTNDTIELLGYSLSDDTDEPQAWTFQNGRIAPKSFLLILASGDNKPFVEEEDYFHTNFKISSSKETILLSDPTNTIVDYVHVPSLAEDFSYGRKIGSDEWVMFEEPTPEATNGQGGIVEVCTSELSFSLEPGFYDKKQEIKLGGSDEIRYTLNGDDPTSSSTLYTDEITIKETTVIKAGCFAGNSEPAKIYTSTYFLGYETKLPVWSISTNPDHFFSEETGIYVFGEEGSYEESAPYKGANFWEDWERPVHVEFFEEDKKRVFELDCGIKVFGNWSRSLDKKSMSLHFRKKYGPGKLDYPLYPDYPGVKSFNNLILRSSGNDFWDLQFRDGFNQTLIEDANFETQKYRASVVFINGEYWGIHNIREKVNSSFFEENYGIDAEDIDLGVRHYETEDGDITPFINFSNSLRNGELSYEEITNTLDIESMIDYHAYEIYIANYDWPANNVKYWRQRSVNGKWRWFMYDTDMSTAMSDSTTKYDFNAFKKATTFVPEIGWPYSEKSTLILRKLLEEPVFKEAFVNRYCDLINTTFLPENVFELLQSEILDRISDEMVLDRYRWNKSIDGWRSRVNVYKDFWTKRATYARLNMQSEISLDRESTITLNISPAGAGYIKLNTIEIEDENWSGVYFKGVPVTIEAVPNVGYTFSHWDSDVLTITDNNQAKITDIDLLEDNVFTANFVGSKKEQLITISEINYHSPEDMNTQDWLEVHNYGNAAIDLSGWSIKDERLYNNFTVPEGTIIGPDERLVFAEVPNEFRYFHPDVDAIGPLDFSLSNGGETIYFYNNRGILVQQISYDDAAPWNVLADGYGQTLELITPGASVTDPNNWEARCYGGSPAMAFSSFCERDCNALIDTTVSRSANILMSNQVEGTFQWFNCVTGDIIEGETNATFAAQENGEYAVRVSSDGCTVISECQHVIVTDTHELEDLFSLELYPNPTKGSLVLYTQASEISQVIIRNNVGQIVQELSDLNNSEIELTIEGTPGFYFLEVVDSSKNIQYLKIIKN